jgi:MFS family permease
MSSISKHEIGLGRAIWRRLLQLDQPVPSRTDQEVEAEVKRNYPWNFTVNLLDGVMFWFGFNFVSASTIVPLFVSKLTLNPFIIGLVAVIAQSSWYLPQLLTAGQVERLPRKKPMVINLGFFLERFPTWLWPLAALISPQFTALALVLFFVSYAWHGLGAGAIGPAWQDLIARCFPVNRRGRFFGLTTFIGTGTGTIGAFFSSWLLENYSFPFNFVYLFLIAAVSMNLSWFFLSLTREPIQAVTAPPPVAGQFWTRLRRIIQRDHNFRRFLQTRLLMAVAMMGLGFVTVAAVQRWQVADYTVGLYTAAMLIGQSSGNLLSGLLADRFGHKLSLEVGVIAAVIAFILAWLAPSAGWYYTVFAFLGMAVGIQIVSGVLITMEFSAPAQRPTYMGITNSIVGLGGGIAPLIGGWLASFSYNRLFALSVCLNLGGVILIHWFVKEPRWQPANNIMSTEVIG